MCKGLLDLNLTILQLLSARTDLLVHGMKTDLISLGMYTHHAHVKHVPGIGMLVKFYDLAASELLSILRPPMLCCSFVKLEEF